MQSSGVEEYLLGVQVLDGTKAYVTGPFGTFLSTSDGGTNWVKHEFQWRKLISSVFEESHMQKIEPNLNAVRFVRPEIGWVVGEFGLILHTRDGGQTWTVQRSGSSLPDLFGLIFLDEHRGWAMGQRGTVIRTNDGGQHWLPVNLETSRDIYGACFEGQRIALVGDRIFLMTENGGSTWTRRDVAENAVINGIAFASTHVILVGQAGLIKSVQ
jgi:photosystem II stability/assembly factor-like uncharacterized protein